MNDTEKLLTALCLLAKENKLHQLTYKTEGTEISFQMDPSMWHEEEMPTLDKELTEEELEELQDKEDKEALFYCAD